MTVTTGSGGGTLGLNLTATAGIKDVAGNALSATAALRRADVHRDHPAPLLLDRRQLEPARCGGTADDADIYYWNGTAFSRSIDVTTITNPLPTGANVDGFDRVDATHFYMSFNGNVTIALPGPDLTVQDEDVVYYNAGTWSVFFDGTPTARGLADPMSMRSASSARRCTSRSTTRMFRPGVTGGGDDADIYSWNGTSFARVINASGAGSLGWSGTNVDGVVWVDATHLYLSYSADTTVPGLGAVQDEDVVYYNAGPGRCTSTARPSA